MNKLYNLVNIIENNMECVILEVNCKPIDLIKLGCFNGDEIMFRLTKGKDHTCTVWTDKSNYSWYWGASGHTLVAEQMSKRGRLIQECITEDFGIHIEGNSERIASTLHIKSLDDVKHEHIIKLMYWESSKHDVVCHLDGGYLRRFDNGIDGALTHFRNNGYAIEMRDKYKAATGCIVEQYEITK